MLDYLKDRYRFIFLSLFVFSTLFIVEDLNAQQVIDQYFEEGNYQSKLDSLRELNEHKIDETGTLTELSAQLALLHYPKLKGHKIKIKYKEKVSYPITASWSFWNIFKFKKHHTYVILIKPGSFVDRLSLNQGVGVIGHEMAHFEYYSKRPSIGIAWWGIKYLTSKKFRYDFEKDADRTAIARGLGYQLLEIVFYIGRDEVKRLMQENNTLYPAYN